MSSQSAASVKMLGFMDPMLGDKQCFFKNAILLRGPVCQIGIHCHGLSSVVAETVRLGKLALNSILKMDVSTEHGAILKSGQSEPATIVTIGAKPT